VGFGEDQLPKETLRSPLQHFQNLDQLFRDTRLFLSREAYSEVQALIDLVKRAAHLEFKFAEAEVTKRDFPDLGIRMPDLYGMITEKAESCIEMLHRDAGSI
jgi:hypothetical protein